MKRSAHPNEQISCPNCKSANIHSTCGKLDGEKRIRYKRCLDCNCKFKTEQVITKEVIVPKRVKGGSAIAKQARLTEDDVLFIRGQALSGIYTRKDLALQYEVDVSYICKIQSGKTWKHLLVEA